jgi:hypothetical protein
VADEINDQFVDVDFTKDPNYVFGDLGVATFASFREYEKAEVPLTEAEIQACIEYCEAHPGTSLEYMLRRAYNQKQEGSCVGNATTQGVEEVGYKQIGDRMPELSAISLYKQIGRSASSGAMVSDAMVAIEETGILPLDTPANRQRFGNHVMPATGFSTRYPDGWKETAAKFRGVEFLVIRNSVSLIYSALCKGHPVVVGREGHSILYQRVMNRNGRRVVKYINSWGNWGDAGGNLQAGFGYDTENQIRKSASWAFAIRSVTVPDAA